MTIGIPAFTSDQKFPFTYLRMGMWPNLSPCIQTPSDMAVTNPSGLQVSIAAGEAYIQQTVSREGTFYAQRGLYYVFNDGVATPYNTITAPVTNNRVDRVVLRVYDTFEQQSAGSSFARFEWIPGTESASAQVANYAGSNYLSGAAAVPANSILLANTMTTAGGSTINSIATVAPGAWIPLMLAVSGSVGTTPIASFRVINNQIWMRGIIIPTGAVANAATILTLPTGIVPAAPTTQPSTRFSSSSFVATSSTLSTAGVLTSAGGLLAGDSFYLPAAPYNMV